MSKIFLDTFEINNDLLEQFEFRRDLILVILTGDSSSESLFKKISTEFKKNQKVSFTIFDHVFENLKIVSLFTTIHTGDISECSCRIVFGK